MYKEILSATAIALTFFAFLPYIRSVARGDTKPHMFSWVIWGMTTCIVFFAQISDDGGAGAWPIGVSGLVTLYVAWLAYMRRADISITRADWVFLALAMSSLPIWYVTLNPLWAVIVLTITDLLGFGPTFRKAYIKPFEEKMAFFAIIACRNVIAIGALENYSPITVTFPLVITIACGALIIMVSIRRGVFLNR